ncbi:MAG: hypothetical protein EOM02_10585 [Synergistales bacterium]|nr:hypothetical protein [Synergistales bacterium]
MRGLKDWLDENACMSDFLMWGILIFGTIAAAMGLKEFFGTALGAVTTYVVKDKTSKTQAQEERTKRLEVELLEERRRTDEFVAKAAEIARKDIDNTELDELVARANRRISGGTD